MYRYINIASDPEYKACLTVERIRNALKACPEFVPDKQHWFKNREGVPWFRVNLRRCDARGNYSADLPQDGDMANMVELIGMDTGDDNTHDFYLTLARRIADALGWTIIVE